MKPFPSPFPFPFPIPIPIAIAIPLLLLSGCRSHLVDPDAFSPPDLSPVATFDAGPPADLATDGSTLRCGRSTCDRTNELCIFIDRGDCSSFTCVVLRPECAARRDCSCLGDGICSPLRMGDETLTCKPAEPIPDQDIDITCASSLQCV